MAQAVTIAANVNGFDTLSIVPATFAACMARAGYRFCGRYISLAKPEAPGYQANWECHREAKSSLISMWS